MAIAIDVPGLDRLLGEVAPGRLVVLEGGPDPAKTHLALRIAVQSARLGRPVRVVDVRGDAHEAMRRLPVPVAVPVGASAAAPVAAAALPEARTVADWDALRPHLQAPADLVVDGFSLLACQVPAAGLARALVGLRAQARAAGTVALLVLDDDVLDAAARAAVLHLADGIVRFEPPNVPEGTVHYLRVPRWTDGRVLAANVHYAFDGRRLLIDTRQRVN